MIPAHTPRRQPYPDVTCGVCGWTWTPRKPQPVECPDCHSRQWDQPVEPKEDKK
jgi:predicted Zn-ribbon and HTH transcriptional regulator